MLILIPSLLPSLPKFTVNVCIFTLWSLHPKIGCSQVLAPARDGGFGLAHPSSNSVCFTDHLLRGYPVFATEAVERHADRSNKERGLLCSITNAVLSEAEAPPGRWCSPDVGSSGLLANHSSSPGISCRTSVVMLINLPFVHFYYLKTDTPCFTKLSKNQG